MLPKDAAERLGIAKPTLRKWAHEFAPWLSAEAGQPGAGQDRRYSDSDIATLQRIKSALAQRYSYQQIREQLGDAPQPPEAARSDLEGERSATAPHEQVLILDERPEMEALRLLLDAQRSTLEAQRATLEAQGQFIASQRAQLDALERGLTEAHQQTEDTRADLVEQLAEARAQVLKVPKWLRALLGIASVM